MCLGVPGKICDVRQGELRYGRVAFGGVVRDVCLEYVPEAREGDWVIVHVGFAISRIDEDEAARVTACLKELGELELGPRPQGEPE
jgi:hydrogenase expression/formation protein HypC